MTYALHPLAANIVKIEFIGDITDEDASQNSTEIDQYLQKATPEKPLHFLVDASRMGKISTKARQVFTERNKNPLVGSTAIYGVNRAIKVLGVFIAKASGRNNLHFFDSEAEGLVWLKDQ